MDLTLRRLCIAALLASASSLVACGGDDPDTTPDAGTDTGTDTDPGDGGLDIDVSPDTDGGTCENPCVRASDCRTAGLANAICVDGCCEEQPVINSCTRHLAPCDSDEATTEGFVCDTAAGLCLQRCSSDETLDARGGNCPVGSYCFADVDPAGPVDPVSGATLDGVCGVGTCDGSIFDEDACEGVDLGTVTCTADTCTCLPVANGASFCISAGTATEGDACGLSADDNPPASDLCEAGLLCFENTCVQPCDTTADDACGEGQTCIEAYDITTRNKPGVCGVECTPFSEGECADGFFCEPVIGRFDINAWMCMPAQGRAADGTLEGPAAAGEACLSGVSTLSGNCEEGHFCLAQETDGPTFCEKTCDPTGRSDEALASCGGDVIGEQIVAPFAFGEATDYLAQAAGTVSVDLRLADGTFVRSADLTFAAGEVSTVVATIADYTEGGVDLLAISDLVEGETLPETGIRALHASADAGDVDGYLTQVASVGFGDIAAWTVPAGAGFVRTWAGGDDLLDPVPATLVDDTTTAVVVFVGDSGPEAGAGAIAPGTGGNSAVYFFNATDGDLDVYAGCADGTDEAWDACTGANLLDTIASNDPATLEPFTVPSASVTLFAIESGVDPADATAAISLTVTPAGNAAHVLLITDDAIIPSAALTQPTGGAQIVAVHAVPGGPEVLAGFEGAPVFEALAYGEPFGGDDSAFAAVPAGSYALTVRGAGSDATTAPALETVVDIDALVTAIVTGSAAGGTLTAVAIIDEDIAAPAAGEGALRAVHAGVGVGEVAIHLPGTSDQICTSRFIIDSLPGLCGELCTPYPRTGGGSYDGCDDSTDSCIPYAVTEEPGDLAGYCVEDEGTAGEFESCGNPGNLGGDCADFAVCLGEDVDSTTGSCLPLCQPFSEDACGENTCSGVPPILGSWELSYCLDDAQEGEALGPCSEEGLPCAADFTLCLDLGDGATCYPVCRGDFDDCAAFAGTSCETGDLNPEVVPPFMGLCY